MAAKCAAWQRFLAENWLRKSSQRLSPAFIGIPDFRPAHLFRMLLFRMGCSIISLRIYHDTD